LALHLLQIWLPVLFIPAYGVALAATWEEALDPSGTVMLCFGALLVYSAERFPDARNPHSPRHRPLMAWILLLVSACSAAALLGYVLWSSWASVAALLVLGAVAMSYCWLRRWVLAKAIAVGFAFAYGLIALGFAMSNPWYWSLPELLFGVQILLLFAVGTVLCDVKDAPSEAEEEGLRRAAVLLLFVSLACALVLLRVGDRWAGLMGSVTMGSLAVLPKTFLRQPLLGPLLVDGVLLAAALALLFKPQSLK
jgi:hypothetical protein